MKKIISIIFTFIIGVAAMAAMPKNTNKLVNDFANILTENQESTLTNLLIALNDSTSNQICIVTINDLEGKTPAEYSQELGQSWGVGNKKFDNGIVILVKPKTKESKGEVFIATGYGVEGDLPDAICKRIINNEIIPQFKKNDYYTGIYNAVVAIESHLTNPSENKTVEDEWSIGWIIIFIFIVFIIYISICGESSGGSSGGYSGGSYHSSGFGHSSGSSFGGFGGGSFGGGGAGGSW